MANAASPSPGVLRTNRLRRVFDDDEIVRGALVVAMAVAISMLGAYALMEVGKRSLSIPMTAAQPGSPPPIAGSISLQTAPVLDIAAYRAE